MGHKIFRRSMLLVALTIMLTMGAFIMPQIAQAQTDTDSNCVLTPDLVSGQGFQLEGFGFQLEGFGFQLEGFGFQLEGFGFQLEGFGLDPNTVLQDIVDNPAETSWLVDFVRPINGATDFNTQTVAVIIVDNDVHGDQVTAVYEANHALLESELGTSNIELHRVNIGDAGYNADVVATRLREKVAELEAVGIQRFVVNMSFGLIPCADEIPVGDTTINFDFDQALDRIDVANEDYPINHIFECVTQINETTYIAHFGYENPRGVPVYIPYNTTDVDGEFFLDTNFLRGGGLSDDELQAATPVYFSRPRVVEGRAGRSGFYPNSAFQVVFDGTELTWTLHGREEKASADSSPCDPHPDILPEVLSQIAETDAPAIGRLECVVDNNDGTLTAHFGYTNNNSPDDGTLMQTYVPVSAANTLSGGALSETALTAATPRYFGIPNLNAENPGRSANFPNSAFQVVFNSEEPLVWNLFGQVITASTESEHCATPTGYGLQDYLAEQFAVTDDEVTDVMVELFAESERADDPLQDLRVLLQEYLSRSATDETFRLVPVASSGNFRPWFAAVTGSSEVLPLAPARWAETVAVGATLGNPADLWQFSHDSNVAVVGGSYVIPAIEEDEQDTLVMGTSFAAPNVSRIYAAYLTMADSCNFREVDGTIFPPILEPSIFNNSRLTSDASSPFDCNIPTEQSVCDGLTATIFVDPATNLIVGGPDDGQPYAGELRGTDGNDVMIATNGDDRVLGSNGNDVICGLAGADNLLGGNGADRLFGDAGMDTIAGENGNDQLFGGAGDDDLSGGNSQDTLFGDDGNDTLNGNSGDDQLDGGAGNDIMRGEAGQDELSGGIGDDNLNGGNGDDTLTGALGDDQLFGEGGQDRLDGGNGDDTLDGGRGDDTLIGGTGNDTLIGGDNNDTLYGGSTEADDDLSGTDNLSGGNGDDRLYGGDDSDMLDGGANNDQLFGGDGIDTLSGGRGDDRLFGGNDGDVIRGDEQNDLIAGGAGDDLLFGDAGADTIYSGSPDNPTTNTGDDRIQGGAGRDTAFLGDGDDTVSEVETINE